MEHVLPTRRPVDYTEIIKPDCRLVLFGERHTLRGPKDELLNHLELFKKMGFTHLAMEMFDSEMQPDLDAYVDRGDPTAYERLESHVRAYWFIYAERWTAKYMQMVDVARHLGIKIVPIDPGRHGNGQNEWMSRIISAKLAENTSVRLLAYTGSLHTEAIPALLSVTGINPVSIRFVGGLRDFPGARHQLLEDDARRLHLADQRFMIASDKSSSAPNFDWIIHLPQVEDPTPYEIGESFGSPYPLIQAVYRYEPQPIQVDKRSGSVSMNEHGVRFLFSRENGLEFCVECTIGADLITMRGFPLPKEIARFLDAMGASLRNSRNKKLQQLYDAFVKRYF